MMLRSGTEYHNGHQYVVFYSAADMTGDVLSVAALHDPDCHACAQQRAQDRHDMFAAAALQGLLSNYSKVTLTHDDPALIDAVDSFVARMMK